MEIKEGITLLIMLGTGFILGVGTFVAIANLLGWMQ